MPTETSKNMHRPTWQDFAKVGRVFVVLSSLYFLADILKDADLSELTSKRVRRKLEEIYGLDFTDR